MDKFFELNLEEIIQNKDFDRFKIFWFFFSKEAFRGKSHLTSVESGSKKLQSQVSDELRKQGITVTREDFTWGKVATFLDPDGNMCEFKNADDGYFV